LCTQPIYICSKLFKERPRYALTLIQQSGKKMLIRDFRMIGLRSQILRGLQRLLHLLRVFVDAHASTYEREPHRQLRGRHSDPRSRGRGTSQPKPGARKKSIA